jgi:predicted membrane-bound mannosyltransferase
MREVVVLTVVGVAIAIPAAIALTRLVRTQLYGVAPADPVSIVLAALVLWQPRNANQTPTSRNITKRVL